MIVVERSFFLLFRFFYMKDPYLEHSISAERSIYMYFPEEFFFNEHFQLLECKDDIRHLIRVLTQTTPNCQDTTSQMDECGFH